MGIDVVVATEKDAGEWDAINRDSPHGTIFHRWRWLKIAEGYTDARLYPLMFVAKGEPLGIFPLFFKKTSFLRAIFSPPLRLAIRFHGPVLNDRREGKGYKKEQNLLEVQREADNFIQMTFHPHLTVISNPPRVVDMRTFRWRGYGIDVVYDYLSDLRSGPEKLWERLKANQQRNVRKSEKLGMVFERGHERELEVLYDLVVRRYREQGKTVNVPKQYLLDLCRAFPDEMNIFVVRYQGNIVTGSIDLLVSGGEMTAWIGTPKPAVPITPSPNDLISWETMKYASTQGVAYYSVLGAATNERLSKYYSAKFPDHELRMRYVVKKGIIPPDWLLQGYMRIIKPISEKVRSRW
jgi:Acetyltransferase (GNAT) domain